MIKIEDNIAYSVLERNDPVEVGIRVGPPYFESVNWSEFLYDSAARHGCLTEEDAFNKDRLARVMRDIKIKLQQLYKNETAVAD